MLRRFAPVATAVAVGALLAFPAAGSAQDFAGTALNIIPSGQYGSVPVPAGADTQAKMYDALTPLFDKVTTADLFQDFKSEKFGAAGSPGPTRVEPTPRAGLTIVRDAFDVPHITGQTRDDAIWGAGWVLEEDRSLLLAEGRYPARFAALDAPGIDAFSLVTGLKTVTVTPQADALINREQTAALLRLGAEGRGLLHDIDVYVQGVNARLAFEHSTQKPWTRVDVYAINALAGQIFGQGGGDEVRRSQFLVGLDRRLGSKRAQTVFNDLSEHNDADTPTSMPGRFPYEPIPRHATGNALIAPGTVSSASAGFAARAHKYASNFQLVSASRSATGHPLFVGGPQIGYYYPGLTLEMDLHAPGIDARGAAIPGGPGDILIGRGPDFAWSLTSAGSDTNDEFVETLCGGSIHKYLYKGRCRAMGHIVAGNIVGQGPVAFYTTVHGPVEGWARTASGKRVAVSFDRSSHGQDILWQVMFRRLSDEQVTGPKTLFAAAATSPFTFNVGYADDKHIAMVSAGRLPIRDPRVDPRLPTIGTGQYDWEGFLSANGHPHVVDPPSGVIVNWNNKPALGFGSSDSEWGYGSTQRVQMIETGIAKQRINTLASVVSAMNAAATKDFPDQGTVFAALDHVLGSGPAPSARDAEMLTLLEQWNAAGSSRLDRNLDGIIDAGGAPAIMDAAYPLIAKAMLTPVLGPALYSQLTAFEGSTNNAQGGFENGLINYVDKDLRELLGTRFRSPFATHFCGRGSLAACRGSLWAAMDTAGNQIAAAQGTNDPTKWTANANAERIHFAPGLLTTTIRYTNRPSGIQQVLTFTGHRAAR